MGRRPRSPAPSVFQKISLRIKVPREVLDVHTAHAGVQGLPRRRPAHGAHRTGACVSRSRRLEVCSRGMKTSTGPCCWGLQRMPGLSLCGRVASTAGVPGSAAPWLHGLLQVSISTRPLALGLCLVIPTPMRTLVITLPPTPLQCDLCLTDYICNISKNQVTF